ncbi:MAG: DUF4142 domain-containing protein [Terricaulis sp.]
MRALLFGALCVALSSCGPHATTMAAPPSQATPLTSDAQFLASAAAYETYQIRAAEIAAAQTQSPAVKTYAANVSTTHRAALDALAHAAQASGMSAPGETLNEDYQAYLDRLRGSDPTPFDLRYATQQVLVTMSTAGRYDLFTSTAQDSPLKQWAASHSQAVHDDINAARQLARDTR